ncbi:MAG: hypothetical protein LBQ47_01345 [Endomicrobium sp.]|nr:hypothetical protein [Endomicrobium sp.]
MSAKSFFTKKILGFADKLTVFFTGQNIVSLIKIARQIKHRYNLQVTSFYINVTENKESPRFGLAVKIAEISVLVQNENDSTLASNISKSVCELLPNISQFSGVRVKLIRIRQQGISSDAPFKEYNFPIMK